MYEKRSVRGASKMQKNVSPVLAIVIILICLGIVAFAWTKLSPRSQWPPQPAVKAGGGGGAKGGGEAKGKRGGGGGGGARRGGGRRGGGRRGGGGGRGSGRSKKAASPEKAPGGGAKAPVKPEPKAGK